jgi:hypothetical protein
MPPQTGNIPSNLVSLIEDFRDRTARQENGATTELTVAYRKLHNKLNDKLEAEVRRIFRQPERLVTHQYITERITELMGQIEEELRRFEGVTTTTIERRAQLALTAGGREAIDILRTATNGGRAFVEVDFNRLNSAQIDTMIGFLSPGSPLRSRIAKLSKFYAPKIRDELVEAIALGYNPNKTARAIEPFLRKINNTFKFAMANPLADAVRMARTAQLYTRREAAHANYQANADVVTGWQWYAHLGRACVSCMIMHGSIHKMNERLNDHYCGRCTQLPIVYNEAMLKEDAGKQYFNKLSPEEQRQLLGKSAFKALKENRVQLDQFSAERFDRVYGMMRGVPSLRSLIGPHPAPKPPGVPKPPRVPKPPKPPKPAGPTQPVLPGTQPAPTPAPTPPRPAAPPSGGTVKPPKPPKGITKPAPPAKPVTKPPVRTPKPPKVPKPKPVRVPKPPKPKPVRITQPPKPPAQPKTRREKVKLLRNVIKQGSGTIKPQQALLDAAAEIETVLKFDPARVRNLPVVILKSEKFPQHPGRRGVFNHYPGRGSGFGISVSPSVSTAQKFLTTWHEFGHYLDKTYFTEPSSFGFESDKGGRAFRGELGSWWMAVSNSRAYIQMRDMQINPNKYTRNVHGISMTLDQDWLSYATTPREVFARSFAQYMAWKTGNQAWIKGGGHIPDQWERDDFQPIFDEFEKLFGD